MSTIRIDQLTAAQAIGSVAETNVRRRTMRYNVGTDADTHTNFQTFLDGLTAGVQHDIEIDGVITLTAGLTVQRECRFHPVGHGSGIEFGAGSYINVAPILWTSDDRGTALTVSIAAGARSFTVPGGVTLAAGDIVILSSFDQITPTGNHPGTMRTFPVEAHRILEVAGGIAYLCRDVRHAMSTTGKAAVKKETAWHKYSGFEGLHFYYTAAGAIYLQGVDGLSIRDCTFHGPATAAVSLNGVLDARIEGNSWRNGVDSTLYGLIATMIADSCIDHNHVSGWWHEWHTTSAAASVTEASSDGSVADVAALKALPVAGLTNGKSYTVTSESALRYVWRASATSGVHYPDDKSSPTTTPGFWIPKCTFSGCNDYSISHNRIVSGTKAAIASSCDPIATHFHGCYLEICDNDIHVDSSGGGGTSTGIACRTRDTLISRNRIFGGKTAIGIQLRGVRQIADANIITDCLHGIQANSTSGEASEKSGTLGSHVIRNNVSRRISASDIVVDAGHASEILNNRAYDGMNAGYTGRPAARFDIGESGCTFIGNVMPRSGVIDHFSLYLRTGKTISAYRNNQFTSYGESLGIGSGDGTTHSDSAAADLTRDLMPETRWDYETPRISSRFITASARASTAEEPGYEGGSYTPDPLNPEALHLANGETRIFTADAGTEMFVTAPSGITFGAPSDPYHIPGGKAAAFRREGSTLQLVEWTSDAYEVVTNAATAITLDAADHRHKQLNCTATGGAITVTIDTSHGCSVGDDGYIVQAHASNAVTVTASGTTFQPTGNKTTEAQYNGFYWKCTATNTFLIVPMLATPATDTSGTVGAISGNANLVNSNNRQWIVNTGSNTLTILTQSNGGYDGIFEATVRVNTGTLTIVGENSGGAPLLNGSASTSLAAPVGSIVVIKKEGDDSWIVRVSRDVVSRSISIEDPTSTEDITLFNAYEKWTIVAMRAVLVGSSSPSVTWTVRKNSDRSATGTEVVTSGTATTSTTTGSNVTTLNSAGIAAADWVWLETTAKSGTVDELNLTIFMVPA